jgi:hypothetical protein
MTNAEKVANFLRGRKPNPFCDQCVADAVQLGSQSFGQEGNHYNPSIAQQNCTALSQTREFRRVPGVCSQCRERKKVTWVE